MNDLDTVLRSALAADAEHAPRAPEEWTGRVLLADEPRRPSVRFEIGLGLAAALALGAVVVGVRHRGETQAPAFQPLGTEYPLTDLGPPTESIDLTVASLSRVIGVPGQPDSVVFPKIEYFSETEPMAFECLSSTGGAGCGPAWYAAVPNTGINSSVDNHAAEFDLWTWQNVPEGADYVTYLDGDQQLWQHPVARVAMFPNVPGSAEQVVAYDAEGNELGRADEGTRYAASAQVAHLAPKYADVSRAQFDQLGTDTEATMRSCLEEFGARFPNDDGLAVLPSDTDDRAVWDRCIEQTTSIISAEIAALNVRVYDPSIGERPENPDPPFVLGD